MAFLRNALLFCRSPLVKRKYPPGHPQGIPSLSPSFRSYPQSRSSCCPQLSTRRAGASRCEPSDRVWLRSLRRRRAPRRLDLHAVKIFIAHPPCDATVVAFVTGPELHARWADRVAHGVRRARRSDESRGAAELPAFGRERMGTSLANDRRGGRAMAKKRSSRASQTVRAPVSRRSTPRPRSSGSESTKRAAKGGRSQIWVGGYVREDGTQVEGYYRGGA